MNADVNAVRRSQDYYRLKRVVSSPGAIYELDVSARALFIGPDSDLSEVRVQYADPDVPLGVQVADISVGGPFVGTIGVDLTQQIPSTLQPARILVSPVDIVDNAYAEPVIGPLAPTRRYNVPATIDLMVALKELPSIPTVRADKTFRFPNTPWQDAASAATGNGSTTIVVPIYGRRMATIQVVTSQGYQLTVGLVALQPGAQPQSKQLGSISQVGTSVVQTKSLVVRASDAVSHVDGTTSVPTTYTELAQPLPAAKGLADLLVLNIANPPPGPLPPAVRYADIYVKLSDREV